MAHADTLPPHDYARAMRGVPMTNVRGKALPRQDGHTPPGTPQGSPQGYAGQPQGYATPPQGYEGPPQGYATPPQGHVASPSQVPPAHATERTTYGEGDARIVPYVIFGVFALLLLSAAAFGTWLWFFMDARQVPPPALAADAGVVLPDAAPSDAPTFFDAPLVVVPRAPHGDSPGHVAPQPQRENPEPQTQEEPDASVAPDPFPEGEAHFSGHWTGDGWRYRVVLTLVREGQDVSGSIRWTLLETSDELFEARVGESATELVTGTYDSAGHLRLEGQSVSDASLINSDGYRLQVAASGMLTGSADEGGGRFLARRE